MALTLASVIAFILYLLALAFAVAALIANIAAFDDSYHNCGTSLNIAAYFEVGSSFFLVAAQIAIMVATRCLCGGRDLRPGDSRTQTIVGFICCWATFFGAEACLLFASKTNASYAPSATFPLCDSFAADATLMFGIFLILVSGSISASYYSNYAKCSSNMQSSLEVAPLV